MFKPPYTWCHYCGRHLIRKHITKDHIVPIMFGGSNSDSNIVWACQVCNGIKSNIPYEEFVGVLLEADKLEILKVNLDDRKEIHRVIGYLTHKLFKRFNKIKPNANPYQTKPHAGRALQKHGLVGIPGIQEQLSPGNAP